MIVHCNWGERAWDPFPGPRASPRTSTRRLTPSGLRSSVCKTLPRLRGAVDAHAHYEPPRRYHPASYCAPETAT